jgi:hypothetical protein
MNYYKLFHVIKKCVGFRNSIVAIAGTLKEGIAIASVRHYDKKEIY